MREKTENDCRMREFSSISSSSLALESVSEVAFTIDPFGEEGGDCKSGDCEKGGGEEDGDKLD